MESKHAGATLDRIYRKAEAARALGISAVSLWRLEGQGLIKAVRVMPGVTGIRESELRRFIESREEAPHDRSRVAAALASPRHGRAGRTAVADAA